MKTAAVAAFLGIFGLMGTMDYAHELEIDALRKEMLVQRVLRAPPRELRDCENGWIITYADAGPKLMRCI